MSQLSSDVLRYVILPWRTEIMKHEVSHIKLDEFLKKLKDDKFRFRFYYINKIHLESDLVAYIYKKYCPWDKQYKVKTRNIYWTNIFNMLNICMKNIYKLNNSRSIYLCDKEFASIIIYGMSNVLYIYDDNYYKFQACQRNIKQFKKEFDKLNVDSDEYILVYHETYDTSIRKIDRRIVAKSVIINEYLYLDPNNKCITKTVCKYDDIKLISKETTEHSID
jgi:hypothetical protein